MRKGTKETSLVEYHEGIFAKIKRFFKGRFGRSEVVEVEEIEDDNSGLNISIVEEEPAQQKRTLFNYDAVDNEVENQDVQNNNGFENVLTENNVILDGEYIVPNTQNAESVSAEIVHADVNNQENASDDFDMDELTIIGVNSKNEQEENSWNPDRGSTAKEEREALERKLMNFYASIKEGI